MVMCCSRPVALSLGRYFEDAVGVYVEGYFDLGDAPWRRRDAVQHEAPQGLVIGSHGPFALHHVNLHPGLAVGGRGEGLALARGGWWCYAR